MINWFTRVEAGRPYLRVGDRVITYGDVSAYVEQNRSDSVVVLRPSLRDEDVLRIVAALAGGGLIALGPDHDEPNVHDLAGADLVVMTSGTSGTPKGVRLTMANLAAASKASIAHLGHGSEDVWLLAMPLHHVGGLSILVRSAYAGGSVRMLPRFDPQEVVDAMRGDVTMVSVVPTMLSRILDVDEDTHRGLRAVLVGGGAIPSGLLERAAAVGLPVMPSYGMTETFGQVATLHPEADLDYEAHPLPGVEVRIADDGRIAIRSDQISSGYLGEPDRDDEWFTTGDIGVLRPSGALSVAGRADSVIVSGGENVDPQAVKSLIESHPGVDDLAIVGVPDDEWGHAVGCLYVGAVSADDLGDWVRENASASHLVPRMWAKVDEIPRDGMGKVRRMQALVLLRG